MLSKKDYTKALAQLGFKQIESVRGDGSHMNYVNTKYPKIRVCVIFHNDTTDLSQIVHRELINAMTFVVYLDCLENRKFSKEKMKKILTKMDKGLAVQISTKIESLDKPGDTLLVQLLTKKERDNLIKKYKTMNDYVVVAEYMSHI